MAGQHGQVLRPAAGHDGVDRGLLDREPAVVRWHLSDELVGAPARAREHALDPLARRRYHGEAVGDALLEPDLEFVGAHCIGVREAGADRRWPERGARGVNCIGVREAGADRRWPERGAWGVIRSARMLYRDNACAKTPHDGAIAVRRVAAEVPLSNVAIGEP